MFEKLHGHGMQYLLTYKLSQDYLETFFCAVRSRGGYNNNPSAFQFRSAYRRLLVRHEIKEVQNGNCLFDNIRILEASSTRETKIAEVIEIGKNAATFFGHDYLKTLWKLSPCVENVVEYIAGYISKKLTKRISCVVCIQQLNGNVLPHFSSIKSWGKYIAPSKDVISLCKITENLIRQNSSRRIKKETMMREIYDCVPNVFGNHEMTQHIMTQDHHKYISIKLVLNLYFDIRMYHNAKHV